MVETPYFAVTDSEGGFAITDVPSGIYTVKAWHERFKSQSLTVEVPTVGIVAANFQMQK